MIDTRYLPLIGLLLGLAVGSRADAASAPGGAADASRPSPAPADPVPASALLLSDGGGETVRLQGTALDARTLRQAIEATGGASKVLMLRVALAGEGDQVLLMPPAGDAKPATMASLLGWLDRNGAERVLLLLELLPQAPVAAADDPCRRVVTADPLPSIARIALICAALSGSADAAAAGPGPFDVAAARVDSPSGQPAPAPITAYRLLAELDAGIAPETRLVSLVRGRDWPLPTAGVTAVDKLDADLLALSTPGLSESDAAAALARLKKAGVVVRAGQRPAVSVRVTAVSADAAARLRAEVERVGGEVSVVFDNALFALMPVDQLRPLAGFADVWSMEANRRTIAPIGN